MLSYTSLVYVYSSQSELILDKHLCSDRVFLLSIVVSYFFLQNIQSEFLKGLITFPSFANPLITNSSFDIHLVSSIHYFDLQFYRLFEVFLSFLRNSTSNPYSIYEFDFPSGIFRPSSIRQLSIQHLKLTILKSRIVEKIFNRNYQRSDNNIQYKIIFLNLFFFKFTKEYQIHGLGTRTCNSVSFENLHLRINNRCIKQHTIKIDTWKVIEIILVL